MAKLSARGRCEIARFDTLTYRIAFMSDNHSMVNHGNGWKIGKKYETRQEMLETIAKVEKENSNQDEPWQQLKAEVHEIFSLEYRYNIKCLLDRIVSQEITCQQASEYMKRYSGPYTGQYMFNHKVLTPEQIARLASLLYAQSDWNIAKRFPDTNDH